VRGICECRIERHESLMQRCGAGSARSKFAAEYRVEHFGSRDDIRHEAREGARAGRSRWGYKRCSGAAECKRSQLARYACRRATGRDRGLRVRSRGVCRSRAAHWLRGRAGLCSRDPGRTGRSRCRSTRRSLFGRRRIRGAAASGDQRRRENHPDPGVSALSQHDAVSLLPKLDRLGDRRGGRTCTHGQRCRQ
jgi:hypothetical protein